MPAARDDLMRYRRRKEPDETGGVLLGHYTADQCWAIVTAVSGPPSDSVHRRRSFYRGVRGLQTRLTGLWRTKEAYYLGEWHSHPSATPNPSPDDEVQLTSIADSPRYNCPEPVLIISGGTLEAPVLAAYVFPIGEDPVHLQGTESEPITDPTNRSAGRAPWGSVTRTQTPSDPGSGRHA